jgi:hypothetical protein
MRCPASLETRAEARGDETEPAGGVEVCGTLGIRSDSISP